MSGARPSVTFLLLAARQTLVQHQHCRRTAVPQDTKPRGIQPSDQPLHLQRSGPVAFTTQRVVPPASKRHRPPFDSHQDIVRPVLNWTRLQQPYSAGIDPTSKGASKEGSSTHRCRTGLSTFSHPAPAWHAPPRVARTKQDPPACFSSVLPRFHCL